MLPAHRCCFFSRCAVIAPRPMRDDSPAHVNPSHPSRPFPARNVLSTSNKRVVGTAGPTGSRRCASFSRSKRTAVRFFVGSRAQSHSSDDPPGEAVSAEERYNLDGSEAKGLTIPTMLTLARVAAVPAICYVFFLPTSWSATACAGIFVAAALTDWLDGYLARKMNIASAFGAFLDPVADKLMVTATLILLCTIRPAGPAAIYVALLPICTTCIISREITMSALREWAAAAGGEAHKAVAVNSLGKWKTATQMAAITLMLLFKEGGKGPIPEIGANLGAVLLAASTVLALWSLVVYMRPILKFMDQ